MSGHVDEAELRDRATAVLARPTPRFLRDREEFLRNACPWFFVDARGACLATTDGRRIIDLEMGRGPVLLGYRPPELEMDHGKTASIPKASLLSKTEVELAEKLIDIFPGMDQVVFGKNGSDACTAAVRIARSLTNRTMVLSSGFHGFHDWCAVEYSWTRGCLPGLSPGRVKEFELNDVERLTELVAEHGHDLAAIILEPAHHTLPAPGFLETCRTLADSCGAVLIFDEVVTAFRLDLQGAQGFLGGKPDLVCLGKAMANGDAISALLGRRDVMRGLNSTYFSMTFQNDNRVFSIASRCVDLLRDGTPTAAVRETGGKIQQAFDLAATKHGLPHRAVGFPGRLDLRFEAVGTTTGAEQERVFSRGLLKKGILPCRSVFACAAMTPDELAQVVDAFETGLSDLAATLG